MFKKLFNYLPILAMASAVVLSGCGDDDQPAPAVTQENAIPNGTAVVTYSVQVLGSSENNAKATGLSGATVTVSHAGGTSSTTTNESGIAVFPGMRLGQVSIYVASEGYLTANLTDFVDCYYCEFADVDSEQHEFDQETVTLPRLGATVTGKIWGDTDFDGMADDQIGNATVIARVPGNQFQPNVFTTTTDAAGNFTFNNLPETEVNLDIDFTATQNTGGTPATEEWDYFLTTSVTPDVNNPRSLGNITASRQ